LDALLDELVDALLDEHSESNDSKQTRLVVLFFHGREIHPSYNSIKGAFFLVTVDTNVILSFLAFNGVTKIE